MRPLFIFSLPRSGSTLLQRILATHSDITTASVSELHLLVYQFYALRERGVYAEYRHQSTVWGIKDFYCTLPNGVYDYLEEVQSFILKLYTKAAVNKQANYFIDKTPRYHLVVDDIIRLFPEGKFIFLWRNPLSVIASMIKTFDNKQWRLYRHKIDLFRGIINLVDAYTQYTDRGYSIRYEDLLKNPQTEGERLFDYLGLTFDPQIMVDFGKVQFKGQLRDPNMDKQGYRILRRDTMESWQTILKNPIRKSWCKHYLYWLGQQRLAVMGYNLDDLLDSIDAIPFSLEFVLSDIGFIVYDLVYHVLELRIMKDKWHDVSNKHTLYVHT